MNYITWYDVLTLLCWSAVYCMVIVASHQTRSLRKVAMPYLPGVLNLAWEICAVHKFHFFWGHTLWLFLDLFIVYYGFRFLESWGKRLIYLGSMVACTAIFFHIFQLRNGMFYAAFVLSLLIALFYVLYRKQLSPKLAFPIAITKLVGDIFAALGNIKGYPIIAAMAVIILVLNVIDAILCWKLHFAVHEKNRP